MSKIFTHQELCEIAELWLKKDMKCCIALNNASGLKENPDAIGWRFTYGNLNKEGSFIVECKASRSDFKKDKNKLFRINPELGCGNWRYFLVQENLVQPHEIPDKWGLIYVNEKGKCKLIIHPYKKSKQNRFNEINETCERFILTRWLNKTENPEKHIYYIRETNNKFNRLSKSHDKLKSEHKIIKEIFNSFYTLNEETKSANDLCTEITKLRNLEYLLKQYKLSNDENDLINLLKYV